MRDEIIVPLEKSIEKKTRYLWMAIAISEIIVLLLIIGREIPFQVSWKFADWSWGRHGIETVTIGGDGSPWFVDDNHQLHHVADGQVMSWDLPSETPDDMLTGKIIGDSGNNKPWLFLGKKLALWDGKQWNVSPMPFDADIEDYSCSSIAIKDLKVWGIDNATDGSRVIQFDLNHEPFQAFEIFPPDDLKSNKFAFDCLVPANDEGLFAFLSNDTEVAIYHIQNSEWQKVTTFIKKQKSKVYLNDVAVDSRGQIWVVLTEWIHGEKVGEYFPQEDKWTWFNIEHPGIDNREFEYGQITVDKLGRVWLSATQLQPTTKADVYEPEYDTIGVYEEVQGNKLVEIQHYTTKNSSLENNLSSDLILGPGERIWTWDKQLVWMDSKARELPAPLPEWFLILVGQEAILAISIFAFLLVMIVLILRVREKQRYKAGSV